MARDVYGQIVELGREPEALERSVAYVAEHLGRFVKKRERVLICFLEHQEGNISWIMEQAVLRCGAVPVLWAEDRRWKTLLRTAFSTKASTIIGPPLVILGLTKLRKANGTPLYIRKVVTAGYPCLDWMIDGIVKGFDCNTWGCFGLDTSGVVAGFSCGMSRGVHLRSEEYAIEIMDPEGNALPDGETGEMVLYPRAAPRLRYALGETARVETAPCRCGCAAPRLMDIRPGKTADRDLWELGQHLQSWTSVLDCGVRRGEHGLEMELIIFPGEKLPKLPSAAKLVVRPWDPERDMPFAHGVKAKKPPVST